VTDKDKDPYDQWAPLLRALGLCPLPIIPNKEAERLAEPGERPKYKAPAEYIGCGRYRLLTDWTTRPPLLGSQPGAGIGLRLGEGLVGIDIDTDDEAVRRKVASTFIPEGRETISRIGARGEVFFLRVHPGRKVASQRWQIKGGMVELLAVGKQAVLPPTLHPKGHRYRWGSNGWTLYNADVDLLPEWSR
jgi:Bifunctional DNA primase/polymerase, N-terminal